MSFVSVYARFDWSGTLHREQVYGSFAGKLASSQNGVQSLVAPSRPLLSWPVGTLPVAARQLPKQGQQIVSNDLSVLGDSFVLSSVEGRSA